MRVYIEVLPDVESTAPADCIILYRTEWNRLLEDAKAKLAAFRKFEMNIFKKGGGHTF